MPTTPWNPNAPGATSQSDNQFPTQPPVVVGGGAIAEDPNDPGTYLIGIN